MNPDPEIVPDPTGSGFSTPRQSAGFENASFEFNHLA